MALTLTITLSIRTLEEMTALTTALKPWLLSTGLEAAATVSNTLTQSNGNPTTSTTAEPNGAMPVCKLHNVPMRQYSSKDGSRSWRAHRLDTGDFCYGKAR